MDINKEQIESFKQKILSENISDDELDSLYIFLSIFFESMTKEDKLFWINIIDLIDNKDEQ